LIWRKAVDLEADFLPPCRIGTLMRADVQMYSLGSSLATELHPEVGFIFKGIGFAVVLVKLACTFISDVDKKSQRALRSLVRALDQGCDGQD
jgi:hypothetical protein